MTSDLNAREIADSLTPGVRQFMLSPMHSAHSAGISAAWFHDTNWWAGRVLANLGLAERRPVEPGFYASIPTALGLEVLSILRSRATTVQKEKVKNA